ncbi:hypothetical protein LOD99_14397 [Oopsacas minuta]|uniref:Disintegrin domain-containing protein n=1 Tax=Oopsacas minuta TaxID=111878 RepID=A0AAV7KJD7_9METZ|nr:hypothetical protein LOD99_14397 [Oopsacas minuta]
MHSKLCICVLCVLLLSCTCCYGDIIININFATCGNGVVETGEDCDCGTEEYCNEYQPCCDRESCTFKRIDFLCRNNSTRYHTGCDLPEYCNGSSIECPEDSHKRDGYECWDGEIMSYCYSGDCKNHNTQCNHYWGNESKNAIDYCYKYLNTVGNKYGNCGVNKDGSYKQCIPGNGYCGKLFCDKNPEVRPQQGSTYAIYTITYINGDTNTEITCVSVNISLEGDKRDPGLVYDGTICAENSICIDQECVGLSTIEPKRCPEVGGIECGGNGICDNKFKCQCNHNSYSEPVTCSGERESISGTMSSEANNLKYLSIYWLAVITLLVLLFH